MRFKIEWACLINGRKFTVSALFYFVFEGNFRVQAPREAYIWRSDLTDGFLRYEFGGLIFGGAYTWRGLFSEFYGIANRHVLELSTGPVMAGNSFGWEKKANKNFRDDQVPHIRF